MERRFFNLIDSLESDELDNRFVYKDYSVNEFLFSTLINNEIWFSDPNRFNDPFDCNLQFDDSHTDKQIKAYYKIAYWKKQKGIDEEVDKIVKSRFTDQEAFRKKLQNISRKITEKIGVTCFSEKNDNILMWSHYTQNHEGVCLKFDSYLDSEFF